MTCLDHARNMHLFRPSLAGQPAQSDRSECRRRARYAHASPATWRRAPLLNHPEHSRRLPVASHGNSNTDAAAKANGQIGVAMSQGEVSNLLDAAAGLNGGNKQIPARCGATAFEVRAGQGKSLLFVIGTAQSRIDGTGPFDLDHESFDAKIAPQPTHAGNFVAAQPGALARHLSAPGLGTGQSQARAESRRRDRARPAGAGGCAAAGTRPNDLAVPANPVRFQRLLAPPSTMDLTLSANASRSKGFVITSMPCSRKPLPKIAFSA